MALRLGEKHDLVKAHQAVRDVYSTRHSNLEHLYKSPLSEADREDIRSAADSTGAIVSGFMKECRKWFAEEE
ncbi:MAG: hypothetical protein JST59_13385 [Actinobacteria bacterium]|nr:hypothetical protein [Actinomycetota bacterium]